jgi:DNA-binding HxlR family transcriptional regulator
MNKVNRKGNMRSDCAVAAGLDVFGDRWTLLIIRDIGLFGRHRFKDFQDAGEGFPTNILSQRLKDMVQAGLLEKIPYQNNPPRFEYHLTAAGKELLPILKSLAEWSDRHIQGVRIPDSVRMQTTNPHIT